ncbi:MAG: transporter substrate-binding domain-containing protein [Geminicoccaceae bacterium]
MMLIAAVALCCWAPAVGAQAVDDKTRTLKVATIERQPFAFASGGDYTGFSIELWQVLARELGVRTAFVTAKSFSDMLGRVQAGEVDAAIANISITSERETAMDFSQPIFDSGLQVLIREGVGANGVVAALFNWQIFGWLATAVLVLLAAATLMWLFERRMQPYFEYPYREGLWRSFWWALNVVVNGGFEERIPRSWPGRFFAVCLVIASLFVVSIFVAKITATLTVGELRSQVQGYSDLYTKRVGTTSGSTSAVFLKSKSIRFKGFPDTASMFQALEAGELDAIVHDAPILAYYAAKQGRGRARTVGSIFRPEKYGIALPAGSKLVEPINRQLLRLRENGTYGELIEKWFGGTDQ